MNGTTLPATTGGSGPPEPRPRPRRAPSLADRVLFIPLGFLWLIVLGIAAVPVLIYMTLLYYAVQGAGGLLRGRGHERKSVSASEEEPTG